MKKILLLFTTIIISCGVMADSRNYTLSWDTNTEPDLWKYDVYQWVGTDTTQSPWYGMGDESFVSGANYGAYYKYTVVHEEVERLSQIFPVESDGKNYFQMGVSAIDSAGNESHLGLTKFYLTIDSETPVAPQNVRVEE